MSEAATTVEMMMMIRVFASVSGKASSAHADGCASVHPANTRVATQTARRTAGRDQRQVFLTLTWTTGYNRGRGRMIARATASMVGRGDVL